MGNDMIRFFGTQTDKVFAVQSQNELSTEVISKLNWLFGGADKLENHIPEDCFVGPRGSMVSPWSTNAVEITRNMGISGVIRIEEFVKSDKSTTGFDVMLYQKYNGLDQEIFAANRKPDPVLEISDIAAYNEEEGLALSVEEIDNLNKLSLKLNKKLTDSEVFGFS